MIQNQEVVVDKILINDMNFILDPYNLFIVNLFVIIAYILMLFILSNLEFIVRKRYVIALVIFALMVFFRIHSSSIGLWAGIIEPNHSSSATQTTLVGVERNIRSDEFLVHTPWLMSQVENSFEIINKNIKSEGINATMLNTPTWSPDILGKPYFWGFLLFGGDYGLSWYWSFKLISIFLLSFEICVFITKNKKLSLLGALWITLSPSIQWWFDTSAAVTEVILLSEAMIVCIITFMKYKDQVIKRQLLIIAFILAGTGFVTILYPPVQVPMAYLIIIFLISSILSVLHNSVSEKKR
ncbi:DUF7657 domain-containing protein [Paenibacillus aceti]|uniref:DUF7657 domain-containing protein n=1 Tax=Paenibacillus aceti TaxID=1820010 RepID=A0ABQ1W1K3_9BACL|nr:hypothetical protein [Paenibacillus aceti]GGG08275.1 hypothetical protein GCM10010913_32530 [Paenibacillus aceti]